MMEENSRVFEIFLEVQSGLPRQGPGSDESTLRALSYCYDLPKELTILDIGCGPGMQTLTLAKALNCNITAVDITEEYLSKLRESAQEASVLDRINVINRDMNDLRFEAESFDLIWAEGSAYIMGFENALNVWKTFLKPGGFIAVSELVWLKPDPPSEVLQFFRNEYPSMNSVETNSSIIRAAGYELAGNFTLPDSAWWDHYYNPLQAKLPQLTEKYKDDETALSIIDATKLEIKMRRLYSDWYGYEFFICRRV